MGRLPPAASSRHRERRPMFRNLFDDAPRPVAQLRILAPRTQQRRSAQHECGERQSKQQHPQRELRMRGVPPDDALGDARRMRPGSRQLPQEQRADEQHCRDDQGDRPERNHVVGERHSGFIPQRRRGRTPGVACRTIGQQPGTNHAITLKSFQGRCETGGRGQG